MSTQSFFAGKTILLTGSTGFLAKAITEKLLRDLPDLRRIHLLIRPRNPGERARELAWKRVEESVLESDLFARLRQVHGEDFLEYCRSKIECVTGDIRQSDLGLGKDVYAQLATQVEIVINSAATVAFDAALDEALETNVLGPAHLLEFARAADATLVHVSTAYVSGRRGGEIAEKVEPLAFDLSPEIARLRDLVTVARNSQSTPESEKRDLVRAGKEAARERGWIDTYTYTKALGEQWLAQHRGEVATVILRPSIIESSYREPEAGWIEGLRMADPYLIAAGRGLSRFPMALDEVLDLIPLDFVVNAVLAACRHARSHPPSLEVFTLATGAENPLLQREFLHHVRAYYEQHPLEPGRELRAWSYPGLAGFRRALSRQVRILGFVQSLLQKVRFLGVSRRLYRRMRRRTWLAHQALLYVENYGEYLQLSCRFQTDRARRLEESLPSEDRERFGFDVRQINWSHYLKDIHMPGLLRNVIRRSSRDAASEEELARSATDYQNRSAPIPPTRLRRLFKTLSAALLRRFLVVETVGLEHLPPTGPCVYASNHCSHLDWLVLREALNSRWPDLFVMGAEDYFFRTRRQAWFMSACLQVLPLNRSQSVAKTLLRCREVLESGGSVLLFPEGSRSLTGELQSFKTGIGILAMELEIPVVPIHVSGTYEAMPKGRRIPKPGRIKVQMGAAIDFSRYKEPAPLLSRLERSRLAAELVREHIAALTPSDRSIENKKVPAPVESALSPPATIQPDRQTV